MADDVVSQPAPTTQSMQPDPQMWARIQDMYRRGLVSDQQYQLYAAKYPGMPQQPPGKMSPTPQAQQPGQPQGNIGQQIGSTAADIIGRIGTSAYNAYNRGGPEGGNPEMQKAYSGQ